MSGDGSEFEGERRDGFLSVYELGGNFAEDLMSLINSLNEHQDQILNTVVGSVEPPIKLGGAILAGTLDEEQRKIVVSLELAIEAFTAIALRNREEQEKQNG